MKTLLITLSILIVTGLTLTVLRYLEILNISYLWALSPIWCIPALIIAICIITIVIFMIKYNKETEF